MGRESSRGSGQEDRGLQVLEATPKLTRGPPGEVTKKTTQGLAGAA